MNLIVISQVVLALTFAGISAMLRAAIDSSSLTAIQEKQMMAINLLTGWFK